LQTFLAKKKGLDESLILLLALPPLQIPQISVVDGLHIRPHPLGHLCGVGLPLGGLGAADRFAFPFAALAHFIPLLYGGRDLDEPLVIRPIWSAPCNKPLV
jgi:hypothetical protein